MRAPSIPRWGRTLEAAAVATVVLGAACADLESPIGPGATSRAAGAGSSGLTQICHRPPANPVNARTLEVEPQMVLAHLGHGDVLGACSPLILAAASCVDPNDAAAVAAVGGAEDTDKDKSIVCHYPARDPLKRMTLSVGSSAVQAHLDHGDTYGTCERDEAGGFCPAPPPDAGTGSSDGGGADGAFDAGVSLDAGGVDGGATVDAGTGPSGGGLCQDEGPLFAIVVDKTTLDDKLDAVKAAAVDRSWSAKEITNDDLKTEVGNPVLRWSTFYAGDVVTLPTGEADKVDKAGLFALPLALTGKNGPFTLQALIDGSVPQKDLEEVAGIRPVGPSELERLVGHRFVGIVHDGEVHYDDKDELTDLDGKRRGRLYFTVLGLGPEKITGDDSRDIVIRIEAEMADAPVESASLVTAPATCPETGRVCSEAWFDVNSGPVPEGCVKLSGADLGTVHPVTVGPAQVRFDAWTESSPGNYSSFAYRAVPGEVYMSVSAGGSTYVDDGDGVYVHPAGISGSGVDIANVVMCLCDYTTPGAIACGNGVVDPGETCDDRNTTGGDGCSADCKTVEPGWICSTEGAACSAAECGDGIVAGFEECEDGGAPPVSGDGCSDRCRLERGFACDAPGDPCRTVVCGDGVREGSEACDDGDYDTGDGCTPFCTLEPDCTTGACVPTCGDGILLPGEACDDGNTRSGDGCSPTCTFEDGFACEQIQLAEGDTIEMPIVYRDFLGSDLAGGHPDFQRGPPYRLSRGLVQNELDGDRLPVWSPSGNGDIESAESFSTWYRDSAYSLSVPAHVTFQRTGDRTFELNSSSFFPLDGPCPAPGEDGICGLVGLGYEQPRNRGHNFHFTSVVRHYFEYSGSATLRFRGDDDVWAFINGKLVVDLGGVHGAVSGSIDLDPVTAAGFGMVVGGVYEMVVFHAERQTTQSNYRLTLVNFDRVMTQCAPICGDGVPTPTEACDDGKNDGSYGSCMPDCTAWGPRCGDGVVDPVEDCDDGNRVDGDSCPATCQLDCLFQSTSICVDGPCVDDPTSSECREDMEGYCGENPTEFVCSFDECNRGALSLRACEAAVGRYCVAHPNDPNCP